MENGARLCAVNEIALITCNFIAHIEDREISSDDRRQQTMMIEQRPHLLRIFLLEMRRLPDNRTTFLTNAADNETSAAHPAPPPYRKVDRQTMLTGQETTPTCRNFMQFFC